jgi:hypothetical protein
MEPKTSHKSTPPIVGDVVVVLGLQRRAELNGQTGTLLSFDASKGRWAIQLAEETVLIKSGRRYCCFGLFLRLCSPFVTFDGCNRKLSQCGCASDNA